MNPESDFPCCHRATFKVYTDLSADLGRVSVCYSQGHEPTLALLGLAGKRLAPTDPDKTVARPPPIPWWDDLRWVLGHAFN